MDVMLAPPSYDFIVCTAAVSPPRSMTMRLVSGDIPLNAEYSRLISIESTEKPVA
jgi:hypothetical protein